jgi:ABC-type multidrug transport system ATPase subunit
MQLTIRNLSKRYANGVQALAAVSLDVPPGMFGLLGPNGAGKSTLMRTLATLQGADSGTATLGDIDVLKEPERVRGVLGYLPQDFGVYPKVSAIELLDHLARLKGIADAASRRATVEALIGNPKLVIVDEPTAGLDPEERVRFHNLLADIASDVVVMLSTHIVSDVEDLCAQFAVIDKGQVLLSGRPDQYVASLAGRIWSRAIDKSETDAIRQQARVVSTRLAAGRTVVRAYGETLPGAGFEAVAPDLEDVYFCTIARYLAPRAAAA